MNNVILSKLSIKDNEKILFDCSVFEFLFSINCTGGENTHGAVLGVAVCMQLLLCL